MAFDLGLHSACLIKAEEVALLRSALHQRSQSGVSVFSSCVSNYTAFCVHGDGVVLGCFSEPHPEAMQGALWGLCDVSAVAVAAVAVLWLWKSCVVFRVQFMGPVWLPVCAVRATRSFKNTVLNFSARRELRALPPLECSKDASPRTAVGLFQRFCY